MYISVPILAQAWVKALREKLVCFFFSMKCSASACRTSLPSSGDLLKTCGGCKSVFYCSRRCRKNHWPQHRDNCLFLKCSACATSLGLYGDLLNTCGGCKSVFYCDKQCQKKDWKKHRAACTQPWHVPACTRLWQHGAACTWPGQSCDHRWRIDSDHRAVIIDVSGSLISSSDSDPDDIQTFSITVTTMGGASTIIDKCTLGTVSYTHLTLPTNREV